MLTPISYSGGGRGENSHLSRRPKSTRTDAATSLAAGTPEFYVGTRAKSSGGKFGSWGISDKRAYELLTESFGSAVQYPPQVRRDNRWMSKDSIEIYRCATCGKSHSALPLSFAADFPDMYANMTGDERDTRATIGSDQCIIDGKWFFIRGCLEIPIVGRDEPFLWGLWASIREEVFDEISDCWEREGRENLHGPFKGRLGNSLKIYPETLNLRLEVQLQPVGKRPLFIVEDCEHPLAIEQKSGITSATAIELASLLLHQQQ